MREELEICSKPKQGISIQDYIATETFFEVKKCSYEHSTKKIPPLTDSLLLHTRSTLLKYLK